eukprot:Skav206990  [mRNA]  locus=scaffold2010:123029:123850:- [translate_table: standard]
MKKIDLQPDAVAYSAGVFACEQAAYWQGALELLCPDPVAYTSCIGACAFAQQWEKAHHLWEKLQEQPGLEPTAMSYAAVAFAHGAARRWQQVVQLQLQVRKLGWLPSGMYPAIASGLGSTLQWEKALALLPEMHSLGPPPDGIVCGGLIGECARSWQWKQALSLMDAMRKSLVMADAVTNSLLLSLCSRAQHFAKAVPFFLSKQGRLRLAGAAAVAAHAVAQRSNAAGWRMLRDIVQVAESPEWQQRSQDLEPLSSLETRACAEEAAWRAKKM